MMQLRIARGIASRITNGISPIPGFGVFNLDFLDLQDAHGNTGTFTRAGAANVPDWQGVLQSIPLDTWRVNRGRWNGTQWFGDDGAGNPLHPTAVINGEQTYLDLTDYATGQTVAAGGMRAYGGRYYKTATGGTTNGASPLVDTGVTDWVDQGIYRPDYGVLLEGGATNKCLYSEQFDAAGWSLLGSSVTPNVTVAPDGSNTAYLLAEDATTGEHRVGRNITTNVTTIAFSCYLKAGTRAQARLMGWNSTDSTFLAIAVNLATGSIIAGAGTIESVGNGWYRCTAMGTPTVALSAYFVNIRNTTITYTGDGSSGLYVWGGQAEESPVATSYVQSAASVGVRQNELGNLKFPTTQGWGGANAFPHAAGSLMFSGSPQHDLSQHGNTDNDIIDLANTGGFSVLSQGWAKGVRTHDATTNIVQTQVTAYTRNQSVQYGVEWDDSVPQFRVGYRVASTGMAWVWSAYSPYDGAFADTGFLQFFADTVGALPWVVRNTIIFNRALTIQEWDNYVIS